MLTGLGFAGLFVVVPNRDVLWRDALVGGFVTAIVLEIMKSAFAYYLTRFPTYTIIYGASPPCRYSCCGSICPGSPCCSAPPWPPARR